MSDKIMMTATTRRPTEDFHVRAFVLVTDSDTYNDIVHDIFVFYLLSAATLVHCLSVYICH